MVVAQVVRVRNSTESRTFRLLAGDPFYTPRVDGKPCVGGSIEVHPGFDQACEGLVVPWEQLTRVGLEVREDATGQVLRCVIGPKREADTENHDWLQFRNEEWEPEAVDNWLVIGQRHLMGTVGSAVELELTFRDARAQAQERATLAELTHFHFAVNCAAANTVFLNVFDLASVLSIPNQVLCNTVISTVGAFHAAVEVYGEEWSFYRTPNPNSCGVCKSLRPRHHPVHVFRQSVNMGTTKLKEWEVRYLIRSSLAQTWPGGSYDLLSRNCIHFCEELLLALGVQQVPGWVRGLHETGASVFRTPWPLSYLFSSQDERKMLADAERPARPRGREEEEGPPEEVGQAGLRASMLDPGRAPSDGKFVDQESGGETPNRRSQSGRLL